jgi:membrane complex biogenesis BtpA family protein
MPVPPGLIGVVHLPPLPGDPGYSSGGFEAALDAAQRDAEALAEGGADAIIVENFGSWPFPKGTPDQPTPPSQVAALALAVARCREASGLPVGVNVLRNDARAAIGIAAAAGGVFVRVNVHSGTVLTDQGMIEGRAYDTLRQRLALDARHVSILADVRVKHSVPLAARPIIDEVAELVSRAGADALIVTGRGTGQPVEAETLATVSKAAGATPVLIGSGMNPGRADILARYADGAIVGTWLKRDGIVSAPIDAARVRRLAEALDGRWRTPA